MKKKLLILFLSFVFCITNNLQMMFAMADSFPNKSLDEVISIDNISKTTDGTWNFKNFEVNVKEPGNYFIEFWLQPATYSNNEYTKFHVYINDIFVGHITPVNGTWQSVRIDETGTIKMQEGRNIVTVATKAPETPEVESLNVSKKEGVVRFEAGAFREYLNDAIIGKRYDFPKDINNTRFSSLRTTSLEDVCETGIPLRYSLYKTFTFTKGQDVFITSSSFTEHSIDVFYCGTPIELPALNLRDGTSDLRAGFEPVIDIMPPHTIKPLFVYTPATPLEMQGLNWKGISEQSLNSIMQVATVRIKIPKAGIYYVRLRSNENGVLGVADLNVNGNYYYKDSPIFFASIPCVIPADNNEYVCIAKSDDGSYDDPLIFIHGSGIADRIVGFNDDAPIKKQLEYGLALYDSYISQTYFINTHAISLSNYSSINPVSTCSIRARIIENGSSPARLKRMPSETTEILNPNTTINEVLIPSILEFNSVFCLSSENRINKITFYDLSGKCINTIKTSGNSQTIPFSLLNITNKGLYIVHVETENGIVIKKIIVK